MTTELGMGLLIAAIEGHARSAGEPLCDRWLVLKPPLDGVLAATGPKLRMQPKPRRR
ncbi:hypothetical protein QTH97_32325 [Variovorax sp. J22R24]|uniref:hypothetical protein n=1 Tax=Variovorax gracilis TaxID=3053502 RepID=UPI0025788B61|nr:hypothetical protein [Variovorax sp. J22R24]MDM0109645.1 hypothetical protein [Variovorax sp. J22R24]